MKGGLGQLLDALRWSKDPDVFGERFLIEHEAGVGGTSIVYRALDQTSGEVVALKVVRETDPDALRRFDAEAEALEKLRHAAIVRYISHGLSPGGQPYLAMEWVEGETLSVRLKRGSLAVRDVIVIGLRVAEALVAAHDLGILHRDVKPSNVLLPGNDVTQAKLADFGLARSVASRAPENGTKVTATGIIIGTPGYLAPEQAHGVRDLDGRADLFSLGCLLFRCLADVEPFAGSRALTVLAKLLLHEPPRLTALRTDIPAALDELVASLLSKDRALRPASAAMVCAAFEGLLADVRGVARAPVVDVRAPDLLPGAVFGRYAVEERLGRGEMGDVYRAHDTILERPVALKVLRGTAVCAHSARLVHEARAAAGLSHPNIVTIHDVGEHAGVPFLAMEYITGRSLQSYVGDPSVPLECRIRWLMAISHGLGAAHEAGVVHGDVKPENVMIGDNGCVKVLDFGLSNAVSCDIMGTPAYLAPEQIRAEILDGRADQFAWGVTAYQLVAGRLPWSGDDPVGMMASVLADEPENVILPPEIAEIIQRALRKSREERFPTMAALSSALEKSTQVARIQPGPPFLAPRIVRRLGWAGLLPLLLGIALLLGVRLVTPGPSRPRPAIRPSAVSGGVTDPPVSSTCASMAATSYRQGMQALRSADSRRALALFEKAAEADPSCPEPQLRLAIYGEEQGLATGLAHLHWAREMRDALGERDRLVLDAWTLMATPGRDTNEETSQLLLEAARRFPDDGELLVLAVMSRPSSYLAVHREQLESSLEIMRRLTELDLDYAEAWRVQAQLLDRLGREDEAFDACTRCLQLAPESIDCLRFRIRIARRRGQCDEAASLARQWRGMAPDDPSAYREVASLLAAGAASRDAIDEALLLRWTHLLEEVRAPTRLCDRAKLALWAGDFEGALRSAEDLSHQSSESSGLEAHLCEVLTSVNSLVESGRGAQAAFAAERFLRRSEAWHAGRMRTRLEYAKPVLLALELANERRSPAQWRAEADDWEQSNQQRMDPFERWVLRWGPAIDVRLDLAEALRSEPPRGTRPVGIWGMATLDNVGILNAYEGRIHLEAGDAAKAVPLLEAATRTCHGLEYAALHVNAHLWLGMAKEKLGDNAGACDAYRFVSQRWGEAKPRSVAAEDAARHSHALGCLHGHRN